MNEQIIGANIRRLRQRSGLTLTALAKKAMMTKSALSKIETGQTSSPISTLLRIAATLEATIAEFFIEETTNPPFILTRKGEGQIISRDGSQWGYAYEALALKLKQKIGEPFLLTIRPGDPKGQFQHGGQEFIYMLSGQMEFSIGGTVLKLNPGDSLYFDPALLHTTKVTGKHPAVFLCIFMQNVSK
ncbi:MAG: XRE family transcriptional regulator [Verrucomicrobiota bacterium]